MKLKLISKLYLLGYPSKLFLLDFLFWMTGETWETFYEESFYGMTFYEVMICYFFGEIYELD